MKKLIGVFFLFTLPLFSFSQQFLTKGIFNNESCLYDDKTDKSTSFNMVYRFGFYSFQMLNTDDLFKSNYTFSANIYEFEKHLASHFHFIYTFNLLEFQYANLKKPSSNYIAEKFIDMSCALGIKMRLIANYDGKKKGIYLDVGMNYKLPYYLSYTQELEGHHKYTSTRIHKFNNFQAEARIGRGNAAIFATYRLTDFIEPGYLEIPPLQFGFDFNFTAEDDVFDEYEKETEIIF